MKYLYLILSCFLIACGSNFENDKCPVTNDPTDMECFTSKTIKVYADNSFSEENKILLSNAFDQWSVKIENRFNFDIVYIPTEKLHLTSGEPYTFYVFNRTPRDSHFVGYTGWQIGILGAVIELSPNIAKRDFSGVAMHEIGHALGLDHYLGNQQSIMHPSLERGQKITCLDIQHFCDVWICNANC